MVVTRLSRYKFSHFCFAQGVATKRMPIREDQLHNWDLLKDFRARVLPLLQAKAAASAEEQETRQRL
jgi:hypothetical protein